MLNKCIYLITSPKCIIELLFNLDKRCFCNTISIHCVEKLRTELFKIFHEREWFFFFQSRKSFHEVIVLILIIYQNRTDEL